MSSAQPLQAVAKEFRGRLRAGELDELWAAFSRLQFGWASTELQVGCWIQIKCSCGLAKPIYGLAFLTSRGPAHSLAGRPRSCRYGWSRATGTSVDAAGVPL